MFRHPRGTDVEHRTLRESPQNFVRALGDQVRTALQGRTGQVGVKAEVGPVGFVYQEQTAAPVGPVRQGAERLRDAVVRRPGRQVNLFISGSDLVSGRLGRRIQV